jgi:DNA-binding response OmpR family regulator
MYHNRADVSFSSWSGTRRRNRREGRDVYIEPRTVDVHIRRLHKAINAEAETDLIRTVRAAGCALDLAE